jgi:hypothetical protein
MFRD